jgi:hypothetical protein
VSESLQDVAGGKYTPVTSTGALSTSVCVGTGCASCVCVCVEHGALCERACTDSFCVDGNFKSSSILHRRCMETFLCSYRRLMFQSVRILGVKIVASWL